MGHFDLSSDLVGVVELRYNNQTTVHLLTSQRTKRNTDICCSPTAYLHAVAALAAWNADLQDRCSIIGPTSYQKSLPRWRNVKSGITDQQKEVMGHCRLILEGDVLPCILGACGALWTSMNDH